MHTIPKVLEDSMHFLYILDTCYTLKLDKSLLTTYKSFSKIDTRKAAYVFVNGFNVKFYLLSDLP